MVHCIVPFCYSDTSKKDKNVSFHQFPSDLRLREEWVKNISRSDLVINDKSASSVVCSKHFKETDYMPNRKIRILKKGTIPTIFFKKKSNMAPQNDSSIQIINVKSTSEASFNEANEFLGSIVEESRNLSNTASLRSKNASSVVGLSCVQSLCGKKNNNLNNLSTGKVSIPNAASLPSTNASSAVGLSSVQSLCGKKNNNLNNLSTEVSIPNAPSLPSTNASSVVDSSSVQSLCGKKNNNLNNLSTEVSIPNAASLPSTNASSVIGFSSVQSLCGEENNNLSNLSTEKVSIPNAVSLPSANSKHGANLHSNLNQSMGGNIRDPKYLSLKIKRLQSLLWKRNVTIKKIKKELELSQEKVKDFESNKYHTSLEKIINSAENDVKASFLMQQIDNFSKLKPAWKEKTIRLCSIWNTISPEGYEFARDNKLLTLPCKMTIGRYIRTLSRKLQLTKPVVRQQEAENLNSYENPTPLVIDEIAIQEIANQATSTSSGPVIHRIS